MSAYIVPLPATPTNHVKYLAILDGRGDRYSQQFQLALACDYLCVVLDHNESPTDIPIVKSRLDEHRDFLEQVKHHLEQSHAAPKQWVHFLINKRDLWIKAPAEDKAFLIQSVRDEAESWRREKLTQTADVREYSNNSNEDIVQFMNFLRSR
jgi:hypothetical protein